MINNKAAETLIKKFFCSFCCLLNVVILCLFFFEFIVIAKHGGFIFYLGSQHTVTVSDKKIPKGIGIPIIIFKQVHFGQGLALSRIVSSEAVSFAIVNPFWA